MSESITDANDCIIKIGSSQAGGAKGQLILDEFEVTKASNKERRHGVGNKTAQGHINGNEEVDISFTEFGEDDDLFSEVMDGNFTVALTGNTTRWRVTGVQDTDWTVNVTDGGDFEFDFSGFALDVTEERI